jgi:hypothetical protein
MARAFIYENKTNKMMTPPAAMQTLFESHRVALHAQQRSKNGIGPVQLQNAKEVLEGAWLRGLKHKP